MIEVRQKVFRRFWHCVMPLSLLDDGPRPFTLLGERIVLWLDGEGKPAAVRDRCCHRTAQLSKGFCEGGNLVCGYHGWTYDRGGRCVKIPQQPDSAIPFGARVAAYHCEARYGYAWVALEDPLLPIPVLPEAGQPGFRQVDQFYEPWNCSGMRFMENAFDFAHQSFVHASMQGRRDRPEPPKGELVERDYGFDMNLVQPVKNPASGRKHLKIEADETVRTVDLNWFMPFSRRMGITYPNGLKQSIYSVGTPIEDGRCQIVQWSYRNDTEADVPAADIIAFDRAVVDEDRSILEAVDGDLPLDTRRRAEFHMASDQPGLLMRKKLLALLEQYGEAEVYQ
ncbi:MAG: aromatic ring-hydroxylating dioxygenase subunit alpha [Proteobacteria bacterium]|nr:aromatic ring-hydroxylating dioxygenase subunit alpha [Burkholderiales bacterium]